jgi:hypothetical protein
MDKISSWASSAEDAIKMKGITPTATMELFLEPDEGLESCGYYFVDHSTRTEFWHEEVSTESIDLGHVVSTPHIKFALEQLYWLHVEYFPMHFSCISSDVVDEPIGVFSHGLADQMTSTFPHPQQVDARGSTFNDVQGDQHNNIQIVINNNNAESRNDPNGDLELNKYPPLHQYGFDVVASAATLITTNIAAAAAHFGLSSLSNSVTQSLKSLTVTKTVYRYSFFSKADDICTTVCASCLRMMRL